jgi:hypothetical protein
MQAIVASHNQQRSGVSPRPIPLFSHGELYTRVTGLRDQAAMQREIGLDLHKAVEKSLITGVMGPDQNVIRDLERKISLHTNLNDVVLDGMDRRKKSDVCVAIADFASNLVNEQLKALRDRIDSELQPSILTLDLIPDTLKTHQQAIDKINTEVEADRVQRIATGGKTARAQREARALEAERVFELEGKSLDRYLKARTQLVKALQEVQMQGLSDLGGGAIDVDALVDGADDKKEKAINAKISAVDKAITQIYIVNLGVFNDNRSSMSQSTMNSKELIVPSHLEKGKAEQFGENVCAFTRNNLDKYFVIHRYVKRCVHEMGEGTFWEPPRKSNGFKGVEKHEMADYEKQTAELYSELKKKVHREIFDTLTQPKPSGFYGELDAWTEVDDGILTVWVIMMRFFPNNNAYCNKLKDFMVKTPLLVQSPNANIRYVCDSIAAPLKEAVKLGVRIPWFTTGLAFIETLTSAKPRFTPYLHPLRHNVGDPEDSAIYFQFLLARVENALNDFKTQPNIKRNELLAYDTNLSDQPSAYVDYKEGGGDEGWEVIDPNEGANASPYHAHETHAEEFTAPEEEYFDAPEYPEEFTNADEGSDSMWNDTPPYNPNCPDYHAHQITKGGKGKYGVGSKGGYKGKEKGKYKGSKGFNGYNSYGGRYPGGYRPTGRGYSPKGGVTNPTINPLEANEAGTKMCGAKGCSNHTSIAFMFCYSCHQIGREQGYLINRNGTRVAIKPKVGDDSKSPITSNPKIKRAFEAFINLYSQEQGENCDGDGAQGQFHANAATAEAEATAKKVRVALDNY